jgi:hypothetical protein
MPEFNLLRKLAELPHGPSWEHQPLTVITEPEMDIESRWLIYKETDS